MRFVQLSGPDGVFYVDPAKVDVIGPSQSGPEGPDGEPVGLEGVREISVNGRRLLMFDTSTNMQAARDMGIT